MKFRDSNLWTFIVTQSRHKINIGQMHLNQRVLPDIVVIFPFWKCSMKESLVLKGKYWWNFSLCYDPFNVCSTTFPRGLCTSERRSQTQLEDPGWPRLRRGWVSQWAWRVLDSPSPVSTASWWVALSLLLEGRSHGYSGRAGFFHSVDEVQKGWPKQSLQNAWLWDFKAKAKPSHWLACLLWFGKHNW